MDCIAQPVQAVAWKAGAHLRFPLDWHVSLTEHFSERPARVSRQAGVGLEVRDPLEDHALDEFCVLGIWGEVEQRGEVKCEERLCGEDLCNVPVAWDGVRNLHGRIPRKVRALTKPLKSVMLFWASVNGCMEGHFVKIRKKLKKPSRARAARTIQEAVDRLTAPDYSDVVDPDLYRRAWEVYKSGANSPNALSKALGIPHKLAGRLINLGVVELGLPPLRRKLMAALQLAQQMDVDEAARSMALGRTLIRGMISLGVQRLESLKKNPEELKAETLFSAGPRLVLANEELSKQNTSADHEARLLHATANAQAVFAEILHDIASTQLPRAPTPGKLPFKEELAALMGDDVSPEMLAQFEDGPDGAVLRKALPVGEEPAAKE